MLKCEVEYGKPSSVTAAGSTKEILFEVVAIVNKLYNGMYKEDPTEALVFKNALKGIVADDDTPIWKVV